jgi:hypothetical protein
MVVQHVLSGMQPPLALQYFSPDGQLHEPPGPEQCVPPEQSASVQQLPWGMQALNAGFAMVHTRPLLGHVQLPPGPVHCSPVTRQSLLLQHVLFGMQLLLTAQTLSLAPHVHMPPGIGQLEPVIELQSIVVQHVPIGMHALFAVHAVKPIVHAHVPPGVEQVSPVTVQSALTQQFACGMQVPLVGQPF